MIQLKRFSLLLISNGLVCFLLLSFFIWQRHIPKQLPIQSKADKNNLQPVAFVIKDLKIKLPIYPSGLENGQLKTISKGISYFTNSAIPGELGSSIFYGHNWPNLLGSLTQAQKGQKIEIQLSNGASKHFFITQIELINPNQPFQAGVGTAQITIYTCAGFLDQKRFVVTAKEI